MEKVKSADKSSKVKAEAKAKKASEKMKLEAKKIKATTKAVEASEQDVIDSQPALPITDAKIAAIKHSAADKIMKIKAQINAIKIQNKSQVYPKATNGKTKKMPLSSDKVKGRIQAPGAHSCPSKVAELKQQSANLSRFQSLYQSLNEI